MDIGYYTQIQGGIYGQPDGPDLSAQVALQERFTMLNVSRASQPDYVPPSMAGPNAPQWSAQTGGPSSLPVIGWTCQNATGPAFHTYDSTHIGTTPDWTGDNNAIGAGSYDMNQVVGSGTVNNLNRAPRGPGDCDPVPVDTPNPNTVPMSQGSLAQSLEY